MKRRVRSATLTATAFVLLAYATAVGFVIDTAERLDSEARHRHGRD